MLIRGSEYSHEFTVTELRGLLEQNVAFLINCMKQNV